MGLGADAPKAAPSKPTPPPPKRQDEDVQRDADQLARLRARRGRQSTILTSPLGVVGDEVTPKRSTLLGG